METTIVLYWGCIGIMEKKMETIIVYWSPWNREEFLTVAIHSAALTPVATQ